MQPDNSRVFTYKILLLISMLHDHFFFFLNRFIDSRLTGLYLSCIKLNFQLLSENNKETTTSHNQFVLFFQTWAGTIFHCLESI